MSTSHLNWTMRHLLWLRNEGTSSFASPMMSEAQDAFHGYSSLEAATDHPVENLGRVAIWFNLPRRQMWLHSFIVVTDSRVLLLLFSCFTHSLLLFQTLVNKARWSSVRLLRVFLFIAFLISVPPCYLTSSSRPLSFVCALTTPLRALPLFRFHPLSHHIYFAVFCPLLRPLLFLTLACS